MTQVITSQSNKVDFVLNGASVPNNEISPEEYTRIIETITKLPIKKMRNLISIKKTLEHTGQYSAVRKLVTPYPRQLFEEAGVRPNDVFLAHAITRVLFPDRQEAAQRVLQEEDLPTLTTKHLLVDRNSTLLLLQTSWESKLTWLDDDYVSVEYLGTIQILTRLNFPQIVDIVRISGNEWAKEFLYYIESVLELTLADLEAGLREMSIFTNNFREMLKRIS